MAEVEDIMPDTLQEAVAGEAEGDPSAMPLPGDAVQTTHIAVEIRRSPGKPPSLILDCREFHQHLLRLGVRLVDQGGGQQEFENLPGRRAYVHGNRVTPFVLLSSVNVQPRMINLAEFYNGSATFQQLMDLAYSVDAVAREVVEHYRPVEIKLRLVDKKG